MKLKPWQTLGLVGLAATLAACRQPGQGRVQPVVEFPTQEPAQAAEASQDEIVLNYLAQVYPEAQGRVTECVTKTDGNKISFVSAVDGMQVESYTYTAFQRFLADNVTMLLPDVFNVEVLHRDQVIYLIPRSATSNSPDPLAGVTRTIKFADIDITFIIIEADGSYSKEAVATEIAQATYHEVTEEIAGLELDPYQEVLANSIGLAHKFIYVDDLSYEQYVEIVEGLVFDINGTMYNAEALSPAMLNYAMYTNQLPVDISRDFIRPAPSSLTP